MSARDDLMRALWDNYRQAEKNQFIDAYRDEVALEIGRDALRDGLVPTLTRLVGEANATKLLADHRDLVAHELVERQRKVADEWAENGYLTEAHGLRQGAYVIEPAQHPAMAEEAP